MSALISLLLTIYLWFFVLVSFLIVIPVCLFCYPFIDQKTFSKIYLSIPTYIVFAVMTWPGIWKLNFYDNRHNKKWNKQYVIVSNHLSMIDSIVLIYHIPLKIKFMIAAVFTKIPIFGRLILASGHITADLHDPSLNQTAVDRAIHTIQKDHCSFALFPEGRRELVSYKFERFKTGAYRIAKATNLPILPVTLHGAEKAMGFGGLVNSATITIWIDNPFNVLSDNYQKYIDYTKSIMEKNLSNYNK